MNIHTDVREVLAREITETVLPGEAAELGWTATTDTFPEWTSPIVQIGHAQNIRYANSCAKPMFDLTVALWVQENEHATATAVLYKVLMDVWAYFEQHPLTRPPSGIGFIGIREQGAVGWTGADIDLTIQT